MKGIVAIKRYMETEPHGRKCQAAELSEFKASCTQAEFDALGQQACALLGEAWEPSQPKSNGGQ